MMNIFSSCQCRCGLKNTCIAVAILSSAQSTLRDVVSYYVFKMHGANVPFSFQLLNIFQNHCRIVLLTGMSAFKTDLLLFLVYYQCLRAGKVFKTNSYLRNLVGKAYFKDKLLPFQSESLQVLEYKILDCMVCFLDLKQFRNLLGGLVVLDNTITRYSNPSCVINLNAQDSFVVA